LGSSGYVPKALDPLSRSVRRLVVYVPALGLLADSLAALAFYRVPLPKNACHSVLPRFLFDLANKKVYI
jgi:hypothetical protein